MAWRETHVMDERMRFIVEWQRGEAGFAELCRRYGISRKTGYKWASRYKRKGLQACRTGRVRRCTIRRR